MADTREPWPDQAGLLVIKSSAIKKSLVLKAFPNEEQTFLIAQSLSSNSKPIKMDYSYSNPEKNGDLPSVHRKAISRKQKYFFHYEHIQLFTSALTREKNKELATLAMLPMDKILQNDTSLPKKKDQYH